jgi:acetolactate synthase-1/3 small subunit
VVKVTDLTKRRYLNRELVLAEVAVPPSKRSEITGLADLTGAKVVAVEPQSLTVQIVEEQEKVENFLRLLKPFRVVALARSGVIAVARTD